MERTLKDSVILAEAISKLLYPFAEVVVHDLAKNEIHAIFNSFSKRESGDPSYKDNLKNELSRPDTNIIGPYEKTNHYDGRKLKSISTVLRDANQHALALLCINLDITIFDKYQSLINTFLLAQGTNRSEQTRHLFRNDLYEQINSYVKSYCVENNLNIDSLSRHEKKKITLALKEEGALNRKNASNYIARALGVSRATIYNYLNEQVKIA